MKKIKFHFLALIPAFITAALVLPDNPAGNFRSANDKNGSASIQEKFQVRTGDTLVTTIAAINPLPDGGVQIFFNERQAIYTISRTQPGYDAIMRVAREAFTSKRPVKLLCKKPGILDQLVWPTDAETRKYLDWYKNNLRNVDSARQVNIRELYLISISQRAKCLASTRSSNS